MDLMTTAMPAAHPHGAMRREDREITDRAEIDAILRAGNLMHLALCDQNVPFLVPVFYAYDGTALYFHSAKRGSKIEILKRNNRVCFEISQALGVIASDQACNFEARHQTVIGHGLASFIEDQAAKIAALDRIVAQFTSATFSYPEANLRATAVIRIDISSLKGKRHGLE
jgi:uncharacterized protein